MGKNHIVKIDDTNINDVPKTKAEILAITDAQQYDGYYCSELNNQLFYWVEDAWFPKGFLDQ